MMRGPNQQPVAATRGPQPQHSRTRLLVGLVLCTALVVQCHQISRTPAVRTHPVSVEIVPTAALIHESMSETQRLARNDPLEFFKLCLDHYHRNIHDYRVTFTKQEFLGDKLAPEQVTDVRFKEAPFSVDMTWTQNAGRAGRVLYVEGARRDERGNALALVRPAGLLGGIGIKVWRAIHGRDAEREARRTIDQFGFRNTLELIVKYSERAQADGKLALEFVGEGMIDGRPTYVFERRLPYTGEDGPYPDHLLIVHVDKEWLLPTGCFSYADADGQELLGRYLLTAAEFNVGFSDADFDANTVKF